MDIPQLVENGNTVPMVVLVDSPMTEADHVKAIHVFNQKNPQPHVISCQLTPRGGRAQVSTRIKLADSQTIFAYAQMSDGAWWSGSADVIVTIAACLEDL
jgi:sulfur-oxidizing protein SoxY